jgi:hypothetical protein
MKIKTIALLIVLIVTINAFAQKQNNKPLYTLCGKSGDCTMTLDEFKKCKKELTPIDKNLKISSFKVTIKMVNTVTKDSVFEEISDKGNTFSKATCDWLEKIISNHSTAYFDILINMVQFSKGDKLFGSPDRKTQYMIIRLR